MPFHLDSDAISTATEGLSSRPVHRVQTCMGSPIIGATIVPTALLGAHMRRCARHLHAFLQLMLPEDLILHDVQEQRARQVPCDEARDLWLKLCLQVDTCMSSDAQ